MCCRWCLCEPAVRGCSFLLVAPLVIVAGRCTRANGTLCSNQTERSDSQIMLLGRSATAALVRGSEQRAPFFGSAQRRGCRPPCLSFPPCCCCGQMSGGNILVPVVAHVVYDVLTFLEVHQRATAQLKTTLEGNLPKKRQVALCGNLCARCGLGCRPFLLVWRVLIRRPA